MLFVISVYEDVKPALQFWKQNEKLIYIYSSGSVEAQKLLFGNSVCGNMLGVIIFIFKCVRKKGTNNRTINELWYLTSN